MRKNLRLPLEGREDKDMDKCIFEEKETKKEVETENCCEVGEVNKCLHFTGLNLSQH